MATEKELNPNNYDKSNKRQKSNVSKIIWITGIILFLLLFIYIFTPYLFNTRTFPQPPRQRAQFNSISVALELFNSEFNNFPPSEDFDPTDKPYCGAKKLAEALMGQDLKGFHPDSVFKSDGTDNTGIVLYPDANDLTAELYQANIKIRKGPYLPIENANAYRLYEIFENTGPFDENIFILCDVFGRVTNLKTGKRIGMPILYYRADTSKTDHDINDPNNPDNIYNYKDNHTLLALGMPGQPDKKHPLFEDPKIFYEMTKDYEVTELNKPHKEDSFILISAGMDGLYGTIDDITNFYWRWKPK